MGIRPAHVAWVVFGGSIGTALRDLLGGAFPAEPGSFPWTTFLINVAGSLLLGILLAGLAAGAGTRTAGSPRALTTRLALGTGLLGGFTTYSTFAVETVELASAAPVTATAYALGSVTVGFGAALAGALAVRSLAPAPAPDHPTAPAPDHAPDHPATPTPPEGGP